MFTKLEGQRYYKGATFKEMLHPATWLTDVIPQETGRPIIAMRENAKSLWAYVEKTDQIICKEMPNIMLRESTANKSLAPFSDSTNPVHLIMKNQRGRTVDIAYRPDKEGLRITNKENSAINVHTCSSIKAIKGNTKIWVDFIRG